MINLVFGGYVIVLPLFYLLMNSVSSHIEIPKQEDGVCYGDLGCFPQYGPFYHVIFRPLSLTPWGPTRINTRFLLYTRESPAIPKIISRYDPDTIKFSYFDPRKRIKIIVHGFRGSSKNEWMTNGRHSLLEVEDLNVIITDWNDGAGFPYAQAVSNTRVVGRELGALLIHLKLEYDINYDDVHIIGHSLGAHIAGYAGEWLNGSVGRISALDAAEPFFLHTPTVVRIDTSDAKFVDAIHSDGRSLVVTGFGLMEPFGHIDFYPDDGLSVKSCSIPNYVSQIAFRGAEAVFDFMSCNHLKSPSLFMESIGSKCPFTAYACESFQAYENGECYTCDRPGIDCIPMGYNADLYDVGGAVNKKFFLTTDQEPPTMCAHHLIVLITTMQKNETFRGDVYLFLSVKGRLFERDDILLNKNPLPIIHGQTLKFLIELKKDPQEIEQIQFYWTKDRFRFMSVKSWFRAIVGTSNILYPRNITLIPIDIINQRQRQKLTAVFCITDSLPAGEIIKLNTNSCK